MTRLELISEIGKGRFEFRALDFSNEDLSGLDLSGLDLRRCNFTNCNLNDTDLTDAIMVCATFSGATFEGAIVDGVNWELVKDAPNLVGAIYAGQPIKETPVVDTLGKYQRLVTDKFIQIGCLKGDETYWKTMDDAKLAAEVDKVNPSEKADAKAWKDTHLAKTISDLELKKPKEPQ